MLWLKSLHVIFVVSWFAALFYLPRLFVYHCGLRADDDEGHARFCLMERKLYAIGLIAMIATWVFAIAMLIGAPGYLSAGWMHAKLALVIALSGYYGWLKRLIRTFAARQNQRTHVFYRWINEVPAVLLVAIVVLVTVKPF